MHVIPAGGDERRFFVTDVGTAHQQDNAYFASIMEQMNNGGLEALLHTLLTYDISEYNVRRVPQTDALREQKLLSLNVEEEWWYTKLADGRVLRGDEDWTCEVMADAIVDDYIEYTRRFNVSRRGNQTSLGKFMSRVCPSISQLQRRTKIEVPSGDGWTRQKEMRVRFWILPSLIEARARWDHLYGASSWEKIGDDQRALPIEEPGGQPPY